MSDTWRIGSQVPINVYEGDRPVCQCQTPEDAKRIVDALNGIEGHNQPCYYCGEPCNALAGNPGKWPLAFPHRDEPGVVKWQHVGCVVARLTESDGYHTFNELYEHRHALFSVICNAFDGWKSFKHADGTMFDGWFIAGCQTEKGQITYHLPLLWWDKFSCRAIEKAPEWDGHTPADVIDRVQTLKVALGIAEAVKASCDEQKAEHARCEKELQDEIVRQSEYIRDQTVSLKDYLRMGEAVKAAEEATREEDARAMCMYCAGNIATIDPVPVKAESGSFFHNMKMDGLAATVCAASRIRILNTGHLDRYVASKVHAAEEATRAIETSIYMEVREAKIAAYERCASIVKPTLFNLVTHNLRIFYDTFIEWAEAERKEAGQ